MASIRESRSGGLDSLLIISLTPSALSPAAGELSFALACNAVSRKHFFVPSRSTGGAPRTRSARGREDLGSRWHRFKFTILVPAHMAVLSCLPFREIGQRKAADTRRMYGEVVLCATLHDIATPAESGSIDPFDSGGTDCRFAALTMVNIVAIHAPLTVTPYGREDVIGRVQDNCAAVVFCGSRS
ncbi:hypothetical protein GGX14DRAFT_563644 [Mycena pura]|uniref:Uncharacterized protein n=1 Tax=Mycena pura TaxID=153505 RepID=A0AAD6VM77_9AGAR|nr:hypothetical protein GGX14DRAFT_563644 [Mycena pura]